MFSQMCLTAKWPSMGHCQHSTSTTGSSSVSRSSNTHAKCGRTWRTKPWGHRKRKSRRLPTSAWSHTFGWSDHLHGVILLDDLIICMESYFWMIWSSAWSCPLTSMDDLWCDVCMDLCSWIIWWLCVVLYTWMIRSWSQSCTLYIEWYIGMNLCIWMIWS